MGEEAKRKAQERNLASNQQLEQQYEEMRESNPIIKKATSPTTSNKNETKDRSIANSTSSSGESSDDEFVGPPMPTSNKSKVTSSKRSDSSGSRLVSGSIDYEVKFWNFAGMDSNLKNFRS